MMINTPYKIFNIESCFGSYIGKVLGNYRFSHRIRHTTHVIIRSNGGYLDRFFVLSVNAMEKNLLGAVFDTLNECLYYIHSFVMIDTLSEKSYDFCPCLKEEMKNEDLS